MVICMHNKYCMLEYTVEGENEGEKNPVLKSHTLYGVFMVKSLNLSRGKRNK